MSQYQTPYRVCVEFLKSNEGMRRVIKLNYDARMVPPQLQARINPVRHLRLLFICTAAAIPANCPCSEIYRRLKCSVASLHSSNHTTSQCHRSRSHLVSSIRQFKTGKVMKMGSI